jgi:hypothetical protein
MQLKSEFIRQFFSVRCFCSGEQRTTRDRLLSFLMNVQHVGSNHKEQTEADKPRVVRRQDGVLQSDQAPEPERLPDRFEAGRSNAGSEWDFAKISIFAPGEQPLSSSLRLQPKLAIGAMNDPLEQEADRIAEEVMRTPSPELALTSETAKFGRKCGA